MTGESLRNPEAVLQRYTQFVDDHAEVVTDPRRLNNGVLKDSTWEINESSPIVPVDTVRFVVSNDIHFGKEEVINYAISFMNDGNTLFWVSCGTDLEIKTEMGMADDLKGFSYDNIQRILDKLTHLESTDELVKTSAQ